MDPRDRVDIAGLRQPKGDRSDTPEPQGPRRPFLQIWFRCCHTYGRLTKTEDGLRYTGRCPRCGSPVEAKVGPGGTNRRSFEAR